MNPNSGSRPGASAGPDVNAVERFHAGIFRAAGVDGTPYAGRHYTLDTAQMARVALTFDAQLLPAERVVVARIAARDVAAATELAALAPAAERAA